MLGSTAHEEPLAFLHHLQPQGQPLLVPLTFVCGESFQDLIGPGLRSDGADASLGQAGLRGGWGQ